MGTGLRIPTAPREASPQTLQMAVRTKAAISMRIGPHPEDEVIGLGWGGTSLSDKKGCVCTLCFDCVGTACVSVSPAVCSDKCV